MIMWSIELKCVHNIFPINIKSAIFFFSVQENCNTESDSLSLITAVVQIQYLILIRFSVRECWKREKLKHLKSEF